MKVLEADVAAVYTPSAALLATTRQVAAVFALRVAEPVGSVQPDPVAVNVTAPFPDPPDVVNVIGVPITPDVVALEIVNVA